MKFYFPLSFFELVSSLSSLSPSQSLYSIATLSHALALFMLFLSVRFCRSRSIASKSAVYLKSHKKNDGESTSSRLARPSYPYGSDTKRIIQVKMTPSIENQIDADNSDCNDETLASLLLLQNDESLQPGSTIAERRRFLTAKKGELKPTIQQLNLYLEWRSNHVKMKSRNKIQIKSTGDKDYDVWIEASLTAMKICDEVDNIVLPRIIRRHQHPYRIPHEAEKKKGNKDDNDDRNNDSEIGNCDICHHYVDREGFRTFCVTPALMDNNLAKGETYTQAVAIYLDRILNREDVDMITILFDCRAGTGWSNNHVLKLLPFLKHFLKVLPPLMPERLQKAIIYPVPYTFMYIWKILSKCLDPMTSKRVFILHGKCKIESPPPVEQMKLHLHEDHMKELESTRIGGFK